MRCGTAILLALAALTSAHQQPAMLAALPEPYHRQLLSFHASSKANGGDKNWTLDEDKLTPGRAPSCWGVDTAPSEGPSDSFAPSPQREAISGCDGVLTCGGFAFASAETMRSHWQSAVSTVLVCPHSARAGVTRCS